jgi:hypothetical protein
MYTQQKRDNRRRRGSFDDAGRRDKHRRSSDSQQRARDYRNYGYAELAAVPARKYAAGPSASGIDKLNKEKARYANQKAELLTQIQDLENQVQNLESQVQDLDFLMASIDQRIRGEGGGKEPPSTGPVVDPPRTAATASASTLASAAVQQRPAASASVSAVSATPVGYNRASLADAGRWKTFEFSINTRKLIRYVIGNPVQANNVFTTTNDGEVHSWDISRPSAMDPPALSSVHVWHSGALLSCEPSLSKDAGHIAMGTKDHTLPVVIVNMASHRRIVLDHAELCPKGVGAVDWVRVHDVSAIVSGGEDHRILVWSHVLDGDIGRPSELHRTHTAGIRSICCSPEHPRTVVSGGYDGRIFAFDMRKEIMHWQLSLRGEAGTPIPCINAVRAMPHRSHVWLLSAISQAHHRFHLYDQRSGQIASNWSWKRVNADHSYSHLILPHVSPSGNLFSSGSTDGLVHIFDVRKASSSKEDAPPISTLEGHVTAGNTLCRVAGSVFCGDDMKMVSASNHKKVCLHYMQ